MATAFLQRQENHHKAGFTFLKICHQNERLQEMSLYTPSQFNKEYLRVATYLFLFSTCTRLTVTHSHHLLPVLRLKQGRLQLWWKRLIGPTQGWICNVNVSLKLESSFSLCLRLRRFYNKLTHAAHDLPCSLM